MKRPAAPEDDRGRELGAQPLPAVELQRRHHREREDGKRESTGDEEPAAERRGRILLCRLGRVAGERGLVPGSLDGCDELLGETDSASNSTEARSVA